MLRSIQSFSLPLTYVAATVPAPPTPGQNPPKTSFHPVMLPSHPTCVRRPARAPFISLWGQKPHHSTLTDHLQHPEDKRHAGIFQLASLKTTLGTTTCTLLICICGFSEAALPLRCLFSRTTFSHVRREQQWIICVGGKSPWVMYSTHSLCVSLPSPLRPLPPTLLMVSAIIGNSALPAKKNQRLSDGLSEGGAWDAVCEEGWGDC